MPQPPGIIGRVNYVIRSFDNPCDIPWALVVETARPAALQAAIAIACFGFTDVVRYVFRPAGLRSGRHGRRGRKGRRSRSPLAILSRTVRKLPPLSALRSRQVSQGVKNLWIFDTAGQRLLWWWLVADVATGFFYNWTTMIQKTEKCQAAMNKGAGLAGGGNGNPLALQTWPPVAYPDVEYKRGSAGVGGFAFTTGEGSWSVTGTAVYKNTFSAAQQVKVRTRVELGIQTIIDESEAVTVEPGAETQFVTIANFHGSSFGAVEIQLNVGFGEVTDGWVFVFSHPDVIPPPVKFNCFSVEV